MAVTIHPTAIVDPKAEIADGVEIGPYAIIEGDVHIGTDSIIHHHAFIATGAQIGERCIVHHSAVVANVPQDLKFKGSEKTYARIGDDTVIREFATIHRGTIHSSPAPSGTKDGITRVGKNCLVMAYAHIAHDCSVGNNVILSNVVQLGGHVTIEDFAILGGVSTYHQFSLVGAYSMIGGGVNVIKDVPPYSLIAGEPARFVGINRIGLERRGFSTADILKIRGAYKRLYHSGMNITQALSSIENDKELTGKYIDHIISFIRRSDRGIISN
jgi:UDP-N-acetylglucosamine acyltransferase